MHAVFGLLNSTPHLGANGGGPSAARRQEDLLRRLAHGALASLAG